MPKRIAIVIFLGLVACTQEQDHNGSEVTWREAFRLAPDSAAQAISLKLNGALADSAWAHKFLGTYYMRIGTNEPAIESYLKALDIYTQQGDSLGMASVYLNLTNVEDQLEALFNWHSKSISLYEAMVNYEGVAKNLVNLGTTYMDQNRLNKADSLYRTALSLSEKRQLEKTTLSAKLNLAILEHKQGQ